MYTSLLIIVSSYYRTSALIQNLTERINFNFLRSVRDTRIYSEKKKWGGGGEHISVLVIYFIAGNSRNVYFYHERFWVSETLDFPDNLILVIQFNYALLPFLTVYLRYLNSGHLAGFATLYFTYPMRSTMRWNSNYAVLHKSTWVNAVYILPTKTKLEVIFFWLFSVLRARLHMLYMNCVNPSLLG